IRRDTLLELFDLQRLAGHLVHLLVRGSPRTTQQVQAAYLARRGRARVRLRGEAAEIIREAARPKMQCRECAIRGVCGANNCRERASMLVRKILRNWRMESRNLMSRVGSNEGPIRAREKAA